MASVVSQSVPVILAIKSSDFSYLEGAFKREKVINLLATCKARSFTEMQAIVDTQFPQKVSSSNYGVYALSEELCRGVDFPSTYQIEEAGGIFILLCGVFPSSTLQ